MRQYQLSGSNLAHVLPYSSTVCRKLRRFLLVHLKDNCIREISRSNEAWSHEYALASRIKLNICLNEFKREVTCTTKMILMIHVLYNNETPLKTMTQFTKNLYPIRFLVQGRALAVELIFQLHGHIDEKHISREDRLSILSLPGDEAQFASLPASRKMARPTNDHRWSEF